jgi:hypothetical protein
MSSSSAAAKTVFNGGDNVVTYPNVALRNVEPAKPKPKRKTKSDKDEKKVSKKPKVVADRIPTVGEDWKMKLAKKVASEADYNKRVEACRQLIDIGAFNHGVETLKTGIMTSKSS